jgi:hypothetical protein
MPEVPTSDEERFIMPDTLDPEERSTLPEGMSGEDALRRLLGAEEPEPDAVGDLGVEGAVDEPNEDLDAMEPEAEEPEI